MIIYKSEEVLSFIDRFTKLSKNHDVIDVFTSGCCYWFAEILRKRFPGSMIYYDPVMNHFVTAVNTDESNVMFDITGVADESEHYILWSFYQEDEPLDAERVRKYCIDF